MRVIERLTHTAPTADFRAERSLFGLETEPVGGMLAAKWRSVQLEIDREVKVLADCRSQKPCPEPARDLLNIVAEAGGHTGRARIGLINRAADLAIDEVQWGAQDRWSAPSKPCEAVAATARITRSSNM